MPGPHYYDTVITCGRCGRSVSFEPSRIQSRESSLVCTRCGKKGGHTVERRVGVVGYLPDNVRPIRKG